MKKPLELRAHLTAALAHCRKHPDKLLVFIEKGSIATRRSGTSSFEYRYTLKVLVIDYTEPADTLIVPLLAWIDANQPDLIDNTDKRDKAIGFEAEIIDHTTADIEITLELSERVIVTAVEGGWTCEHVGEPALEDLTGPTEWQSYLGGEPFFPPPPEETTTTTTTTPAP